MPELLEGARAAAAAEVGGGGCFGLQNVPESHSSGQSIVDSALVKSREGTVDELMLGGGDVRAGVRKLRRRQGMRSEPRKVRL